MWKILMRIFCLVVTGEICCEIFLTMILCERCMAESSIFISAAILGKNFEIGEIPRSIIANKLAFIVQ